MASSGFLCGCRPPGSWPLIASRGASSPWLLRGPHALQGDRYRPGGKPPCGGGKPRTSIQSAVRLPLRRRRPDARSLLQRRLVLQTVWRPRHRLQAVLVDRLTVDDAPSICTLVDTPERSAHLGENGRIRLGQREYSSLSSSTRARSLAFGCSSAGCRAVSTSSPRRSTSSRSSASNRRL